MTAHLQGTLLTQNAEPVAASEVVRGCEGPPACGADPAAEGWEVRVENVRLQDGTGNSTRGIDTPHGE